MIAFIKKIARKIFPVKTKKIIQTSQENLPFNYNNNFIQAISSPIPEEAIYALNIALKNNPQKSFTFLERALNHKNPMVIHFAINKIFAIGKKEIVPLKIIKKTHKALLRCDRYLFNQNKTNILQKEKKRIKKLTSENNALIKTDEDISKTLSLIRLLPNALTTKQAVMVTEKLLAKTKHKNKIIKELNNICDTNFILLLSKRSLKKSKKLKRMIKMLYNLTPSPKKGELFAQILALKKENNFSLSRLLSFLTHEDEYIRAAAITVIPIRLDFNRGKKLLNQMFNDKSYIVQKALLEAFIAYKKIDSQDLKTLKRLGFSKFKQQFDKLHSLAA